LLAARRLPDIAKINRAPDRYAGRSSQLGMVNRAMAVVTFQ
jgi:hypothetical protein